MGQASMQGLYTMWLNPCHLGATESVPRDTGSPQVLSQSLGGSQKQRNLPVCQHHSLAWQLRRKPQQDMSFLPTPLLAGATFSHPPLPSSPGGTRTFLKYL